MTLPILEYFWIISPLQLIITPLPVYICKLYISGGKMIKTKLLTQSKAKEIKIVTRLRLGLSHLREDKFKHSFRDTLNSLCSYGNRIETTPHYFLHCLLFHGERSTLLNNINEIDSTIFNKSASVVTRILLYGDESFKDEVNLLILNATIYFVLSTNTLDEPLYLL